MTPHYGLRPDLGCIEARGPDTAAFLHAQLSRTVDTLDASLAPLAGWHDAKGRLRALPRVLRLPDRWLLLMPRELAPEVAARLRMFVLRAKVELAASTAWSAAALVGGDAAWLRAKALPADARANSVVVRDGLHWIRLGDGLWIAVGAHAPLEAFGADLPRAAPEEAVLAEIRLGIPEIGSTLTERFVPQMLNLDLLDALSFDKGCYPGQEIIARVQHRGSVKRRMRRYAFSGAVPGPGGEVLGEDGGGTAVGEVVRAAPADASGGELLAVVERSAARGALYVAGSALRELPLPYEIPAD